MASYSGGLQSRPLGNRRVEKACERCRLKKIRCDSGSPDCSSCKSRDAVCVYSQTKRRGKGKRPEYVGKLEQRVQSLEALLKPSMLEPASSALSDEPVRQGDLPTVPMTSRTPRTEKNGQTTVLSKRNTAEGKSHPTLIASDYTRSSTELKQPQQFLGMSIAKQDFDSLRNTVSNRLPPRYSFAPMLPKSELFRMVQVFVEDFNATFPIFNNQSLVALCHSKVQEPSNSPDPAWWACINTIIAIVIQSRATNDALGKVAEFAWGYFKNAFSVFGELVVMEPHILTVQAILIMASFLSRSSDLKTAILLNSTSVRMIKLMGLHKEDLSKLDLVEAEQCRRVVWAAFLLDVTLSVQARQSLAFEVSEIQVELPHEYPIFDTGTSIPHVDVLNPGKIFTLKIQLAIIHSKAHKILLNGHYTHQACLDLWMSLDAWEGNTLFTIRPTTTLRTKQSTLEPSILLLKLAYYDCLNLLYAITNFHTSRWLGDTGLPTQPVSFVDFPSVYSAYSCAKVARETLDMISCADASVFMDVWLSLPGILSATFFLISDVFINPNGDHAMENVKLVASFVHFLEKLQRQGCDVQRLLAGCAKLLSITESAMNNDQYTLHETTRNVLSTNTDPTRSYRNFAQGLLTNLPKLEVESLIAAAAEIFEPSKQQKCFDTALLAPGHLKPSTFNLGMTDDCA